MENKYELIIIGGGPAGATAVIYGARLRMKILLITKDFSGQLGQKTVDIENYPGFDYISGTDLAKKLENQVKKQEIEIEMDEVTAIKKKGKGFEITTKGKKKFETMTVILASGANPRKLNIPGEKEYEGKGITYCALCDGPIFADKTVAVIGGGNNGFETTIFLSKIAKKIYILEFNEELKADQTNQEIVGKLDNVRIITNARLKEIHGKDFVKYITYEDRETGEDKSLEVSGVFVEIGYVPTTSYVEGLVKFSKNGEIIVDLETYGTSVPGIFAAGDLNEGSFKQVVIAAGEGTKALLNAHDYIKKQK